MCFIIELLVFSFKIQRTVNLFDDKLFTSEEKQFVNSKTESIQLILRVTILCLGDSIELHCASLLRMISRVITAHTENMTVFYKDKLAGEINGNFLLNKYCDPPFHLLI